MRLLECDTDTRSRVDDTQPPPAVLAAIEIVPHGGNTVLHDWIHLDRARQDTCVVADETTHSGRRQVEEHASMHAFHKLPLGILGISELLLSS